jgi:Fur family transcriptional regulator, ferric uptake regulator
MKEVLNFLKSTNLRQTDAREAVLGIFLDGNYALAHADIENKLADKFDRVTLYRTLKTFVDKGLIHKVLDDVGGMKYAICKEECNIAEHHHHDHVHFKCNECGQTTCLDEVTIPSIQLPAGYLKTEMNLLVQGICKLCENN